MRGPRGGGGGGGHSQGGGGRRSYAPSSSATVSASTQEVIGILPTSSRALSPLERPNLGREGFKCVVTTNHFLVEVGALDLHQYHISISPKVTSKKMRGEIIDELVNKFKDSALGGKLIAYDGSKIVYCAGPLPFTLKEFVFILPKKDGSDREEKPEFKVLIKFAAKPDLQQFLNSRQLDAPQETIEALSVVLRVKPSACYTTVGRSFFSPTFGGDKLSDGLEYWKGFYQSLHPRQMGLSLNINMSATVFYEPILVSQFVSMFLNKDLTRPLSSQDHSKVKKVLEGVTVQVNHLGYTRRYKVHGLSVAPLDQLTFHEDESGTPTTVVEFFKKKYNRVLQHTKLPSILAGRKKNPAMLPMEICKIVEGQRYTCQLTERQVDKFLRRTCQRPEERQRSIQDTVQKMNYNGDQLVNKEFGIQVTPQPATIQARVLQAPTLKYHGSGPESRVHPSVGKWSMIGKKMIDGAKVESWTCVCFSRSNLDLNRFCEELVGMCRSKGMDFNPEPLIPFKVANPGQMEKVLFDIQKQSAEKLIGKTPLKLLIVVLPDVTGSYGKIKRICETELGIVSQCFRPQQAANCNRQYLESVALKINVKTGGRNSVLVQAIGRKINFLIDKPTIVFGADVTHPDSGDYSSPSIAAVVGSIDWPEVTKYRALLSLQPRNREIIDDLFNESDVERSMIRDLLKAFWNSTNRKPERIIFYRDGVGDDQFRQVLIEEVDAIRRACVSLEENYLPRLTFIVVQKRHNTRIFPNVHLGRNTTDKSGNILPGTVVDTKICHPTKFDFYLNSHAGIKGTSRPAHYHVLYDENCFTADQVQSLTNNLCYTYARCTSSVSIVPPVYYAHLAAFRARYYIEGGSDRVTRDNMTLALPEIKDNVKDVMFYC